MSEIIEDIDKNDLIDYFTKYLKEHSYVSVKNLVVGFIYEKFEIKRWKGINKYVSTDSRRKLSRKFVRLVQNAKKNGILEKYRSHLYKINKSETPASK